MLYYIRSGDVDETCMAESPRSAAIQILKTSEDKWFGKITKVSEQPIDDNSDPNNANIFLTRGLIEEADVHFQEVSDNRGFRVVGD